MSGKAVQLSLADQGALRPCVAGDWPRHHALKSSSCRITVKQDGTPFSAFLDRRSGKLGDQGLKAATIPAYAKCLNCRRRGRQIVLKPRVSWIAAILFVVTGSIQAQDAPPKLAGRVAQADSGAPIAGATVTLLSPIFTRPPDLPTVTTDSNGNYRFDQVLNGNYYTTVSADGFVSQEYKRAAARVSSFLHVDSSTSIQGIDFRLALEAVIRGTVVDNHGKPVANLPVAAIVPPGKDGKPDHLGALNKTDALGHFALKGLPAATYLVCANEPAWYNDGAVTPRLHYRETWYGSGASRDGAIPITMKEGDERNDLAITVEPEVRYRVVVWPSGPLGTTTPVRYEVTIKDGNYHSVKQADGSFIISDLPPRHYTLLTTAWAPVEYLGRSEKDIDVTDSDVTVHVRIAGLGEIAGTAKWDGAPVESSGKALFLLESEEGTIREVSVNAQGHFDVSKVLPGKYLFIPVQPAPVAVPRSVQCGGKEVRDDSPLQIGDRQKVLDCKVTLENP